MLGLLMIDQVVLAVATVGVVVVAVDALDSMVCCCSVGCGTGGSGGS